MLLNGHMEMPFNNSISFVVPCKTQRESNHYLKKLTAGGGKPVQCGWLIDKWNTTKNKAKKQAMMVAMWQMKKLDLKKLKAAYDNT